MVKWAVRPNKGEKPLAQIRDIGEICSLTRQESTSRQARAAMALSPFGERNTFPEEDQLAETAETAAVLSWKLTLNAIPWSTSRTSPTSRQTGEHTAGARTRQELAEKT
jgi:hypothetical protein